MIGLGTEELDGHFSTEAITAWRAGVRSGHRQQVIRTQLGTELVGTMLKFIGGTVGVIFLIGLIVVIALLKLVF